MAVLIQGGNAPVPNGELTVTIKYSPISGADIDVSAFQLTSTGKVRGDQDMCFYGQKSVSGGALILADSSPGQAVFRIKTSTLEAAVEKIALTATIHENRSKFASCANLSIGLVGASGGEPIDAPISTNRMQETALILGELYLRNGQWKFRLVAQGFAGGLEPLAKNFGVEVAAPPTPTTAPVPTPTPTPTPTPVPVPPQPSKISLNKITLDKRQSSISLDKKADFGEIKINLNWNSGSKGGFLGLGKAKGIDLDLGCLYELQDGTRSVVQALGNKFGSYTRAPYIELMGDDRTGAVTDGEWLRINGAQWKEIKRILVFAYIYEGAPNWQATDGVITLYVPDQPPIEVRMNEEGGRLSMCGVALLENIAGAVKVSREVNFVAGHEKLDRAYGWGMRWTAGSK
jgi:tellurite resistance protein TerA